jgi:hypothetical protein
MRMEAQTRQPYGLGTSVSVYGGVVAFQDGTIKITSSTLPGAEFRDQTQSSLGGVAGIKVGYTWAGFEDMWRDHDAIDPNANEVVQPAIAADFFWSNFRYKASGNGNTNPFGINTNYNNTLTANIDTYTFCVEPMVKFNLGAFRPYVGIGIGGTYTDAGHAVLGGNAGGLNLNGNLVGSSDDLEFTAEALAGVEYFFDQHWALNVDYKFVYLVDPSFHEDNQPGLIPIDYKLSGLDECMFLAGISYYF